MLCQIFYFYENDKNTELPETEAGLYQQLIRYFYGWKSEKIGIDLNIQSNLKNELHEALNRLALAGLNSSTKFRLPVDLIQKEIKDDELCNLAKKCDLLVLID